MVLRLSDFCRATLTGPQDELPTLETETAALRSYLDVEQVRWGRKLQTEFEIAPDAMTARLPPFLLLPLVENAIKYGRRTTPDVLLIRISAHRADGALHITVTNSGSWVQPGAARSDSTGIGLENLRQRLRRYFPNAHEFTTEEKDGFVTARLRLVEAGLKVGAVPAPRTQPAA
jgi:LytS/YehU family sensor histidine kinase